MVAYTIMNDPDLGREIGGTGLTVWIEKEQGIVDAKEPAARQRPIHNFVMLFCGRHVVDVLRVVTATDRLPHADKLLSVHIRHELRKNMV